MLLLLFVSPCHHPLSDCHYRPSDNYQLPPDNNLLMQGARDQGVVTISHDQEALPGECIVRQCADLILVDLKAERVGLELRFKEL